MNRYDQLLSAVDLFKPKTIVEIGTWNGHNAARMIKQAQKYRKKIIYIGYDLFEDASGTTDQDELNVKPHYNVHEIEGYIRKECPDAEIQLIKGNTRDTLTHVAPDICFIDGGHSVETIEGDYERCKHSKVVILDDFYIKDKDGLCPDTDIYGCNSLVSKLSNAIILPLGGQVTGGGLTMMAMVLGGANE